VLLVDAVTLVMVTESASEDAVFLA